MPRYIDADALRNVFTEKSTENVCGIELCKAIISRIDQMPTADVVPVKHGKWKEESLDLLDGDSVYVCSVCDEAWTLIAGTPRENNMHYCPNCGAEMTEENDG